MSRTSLSSTSSRDIPSDNPDYETFGERLNEDIAKVASRVSISSTSAQTVAQSRALNPAPGSNLDPSSPAFDARAWVQDFTRVCESDPKSAPSRALGVAFRKLNVFGWGTGAEHQRTTGSVVSDSAKWLARLAIGKQKSQRVDILRDFEGVVEKGEMLLVLGPPGSGCSTLLKSLSGETQDLGIESDSHIDFRGKILQSIKSEFMCSLRIRCWAGPHSLVPPWRCSLQCGTRYPLGTVDCQRDSDICLARSITTTRPRRS